MRAVEGHRLRLLVGTLAEPHPRAGMGQVAAVALGAPQVGLQHRAGLGEVLPKLTQDAQGRVGGGVVLHVQGDRRPGSARRRADRVRVLQRDLLAVTGKRLPDGGELHRRLGPAGQPFVGQQAEQAQVGVAGVGRLLHVEGVLAQVVHRGEQPPVEQLAGGGDRLLGARTGDEPGHHRSGDGGRLDQVPDPPAAGHRQQHTPQHGRHLLGTDGAARPRRPPAKANATAGRAGRRRGYAQVSPGGNRAPLDAVLCDRAAAAVVHTREAAMSGVQTGTIKTNIPARMDRLPWSRWHWLVVSASARSGSWTGSRSPSSAPSPAG